MPSTERSRSKRTVIPPREGSRDASRATPTGLSALLRHSFADAALLEEALTHSSRGRARSYERLEFLGDRVLGLIVAEMLVRRFPSEPEGALAVRFALLVSGDSLASVAADIDLGAHIAFSAGEADSGARDNPSILADVCEAVIGALYLDGGLEPARRFVEPLWQPLLEAELQPRQDAKTALQEWAQGRGLPLPNYQEVARSGPAHEPIFTVQVLVEGSEPTEGQGRSKRAAEQEAAGRLLARLTGAAS